jgi:YD repeat-containing protein
LDRVTARLYPDGSRATFAFDATGNRSRMEDSNGIWTQTYDAADQKASVTDPRGKSATYTHDAASRRSVLVDPDGGRTTYQYDAAGRLEVETNPQSGRTTFAYDGAGRRISARFPNATRVSYTYDSANRLTKLENLGPDDSTISSFEYQNDDWRPYDLELRQRVPTHQ